MADGIRVSGPGGEDGDVLLGGKHRLRVPSRQGFWRNKAVWGALLITYLTGLGVAHNVVGVGEFPDILRNTVPLACVAFGETVLVIGQGLDLSVGGTVGLINVVAAGNFAQQHGATLTIVLCLLIGVVIGLVNGVGIVFGGASPFVMTLGMSFVLSGAALVYSGGAPTGQLPKAISDFSYSTVARVPIDVFMVVGLFILLFVALRLTWLGRIIYARGSNPEAALLSGVSLISVDLCSYVFSGFCAALGGLFLVGSVGQGSLGAGQDLLLNSLAATVVGGTTFEGGRGGVSGTVGGALLFTVLTSVLTAAGFAAGGIAIASGAVLLAAASLFRSTSDG
jgi:ribose transport system permease protein